MTTTQTAKCSVPGCTEPVHSCGLCRKCYQYIHHAMHKGVRWTMERRDRVSLWVERLDTLASRHNVIHLKRARRAA